MLIQRSVLYVQNMANFGKRQIIIYVGKQYVPNVQKYTPTQNWKVILEIIYLKSTLISQL